MNGNCHRNNTRCVNQIKIPWHKTTYFEGSPYYNAIYFYNKLPDEVKNTKMDNVFL